MHRVGLMVALLLASASAVAAQDVVPFLRQQRFVARAEEIIRVHGERPPLRPLAPVPVRDSVLAQRLAAMRPPVASVPDTTVLPPPPPAFVARSVRLIKKLERPWFEREFAETRWAYLGSNHVSDLDTTRSWRLRAALEAAYGNPTQTVVEVAQDNKLTLSNAIEFEYWFVVNDTIPLIVVDVGGPLDRGVVVSSDQHLRERLPELRDAVLGPLVRNAPLAPFADYYFDAEGKAWYLVGFDGTRFSMRATPRPPMRTRPLPSALR